MIVIVVIVVVALVGAYMYFLRPPAPPSAEIVIQVDGEDKFFYPLYQDGRDEIIDIQGVNGITTVHLQDGRVRVVDSACPDKICVNTGWTNNPAKPIACLPNKVIVKITGTTENEVDLR